jgi:hypothetical protein
MFCFSCFIVLVYFVIYVKYQWNIVLKFLCPHYLYRSFHHIRFISKTVGLTLLTETRVLNLTLNQTQDHRSKWKATRTKCLLSLFGLELSYREFWMNSDREGERINHTNISVVEDLASREFLIQIWIQCLQGERGCVLLMLVGIISNN